MCCHVITKESLSQSWKQNNESHLNFIAFHSIMQAARLSLRKIHTNNSTFTKFGCVGETTLRPRRERVGDFSKESFKRIALDLSLMASNIDPQTVNNDRVSIKMSNLCLEPSRDGCWIWENRFCLDRDVPLPHSNMNFISFLCTSRNSYAEVIQLKQNPVPLLYVLEMMPLRL